MLKINEKKIGIFVLAYNRLDHLKKVIRPLVRHTHPNDPIYIYLAIFNIQKHQM